MIGSAEHPAGSHLNGYGQYLIEQSHNSAVTAIVAEEERSTLGMPPDKTLRTDKSKLS